MRTASTQTDFLPAVEAFLRDPTQENRQLVIDVAPTADKLSGIFGHAQSEESLLEKVNAFLDGLGDQDEQTWARFLFLLDGTLNFQVFKKLSPFAGKVLLIADYGRGTVSLRGEAEQLMTVLIRDRMQWTVYDHDKYLVVIPSLDSAKTEVLWVGCDIASVVGPRHKEAPRDLDDPDPKP